MMFFAAQVLPFFRAHRELPGGFRATCLKNEVMHLRQVTVPSCVLGAG